MDIHIKEKQLTVFLKQFLVDFQADFHFIFFELFLFSRIQKIMLSV